MSGSYPITGRGAANAMGARTELVLQALRQGRSGLGECPLPLTFPATCGAVRGSLPEPPEAVRDRDTRQTRLTAMIVAEIAPAVQRAIERWGPQRVAVVLGTSTGGIGATEEAFAARDEAGRVPAGYDFQRHHTYGSMLRVVRTLTGAQGPGYVISTACSSSGKVFSTAMRWLRSDLCDAVLTGGIDSLCRTTLHGFNALEVLSPARCRPFSAERKGINIGEGGALLLLEREGDAPVHLLGVGESSDAHHMSSPHPEGKGAAMAMAAALAQAGVAPGDIDHINAHGTGTRLNDLAEGKAVRALFERRVPVVATKGYCGHMLGAAGAIEALFAADCLSEGYLPAAPGSLPVDPEIDVELNVEHRNVRGRLALSNSFAFGGSNVSVLLGVPA